MRTNKEVEYADNFENIGFTGDRIQYHRNVNGYVWFETDLDSNRAGNTDVNLADVVVNLKDKDGNVVKTTTTNKDGYYEFTDLDAGNYTIEIVKPESAEGHKDLKYVLKGESDLENVDTDAYAVSSKTTDGNIKVYMPTDDEIAALNKGDTYTLPNQNTGYTAFERSITGTAWFETDGNNTINDEDKLLKDITVTLIKDGKEVATTTTDENGYYHFDNLEEGKYDITFTAPSVEGYENVRLVVKGDGEKNSKAVEGNIIKDVYLPTDDEMRGQNITEYVDNFENIGFTADKKEVEEENPTTPSNPTNPSNTNGTKDQSTKTVTTNDYGKNNSVVNTGDNSQIMTYIMMAVAALVLMVISYSLKRRYE